MSNKRFLSFWYKNCTNYYINILKIKVGETMLNYKELLNWILLRKRHISILLIIITIAFTYIASKSQMGMYTLYLQRIKTSRLLDLLIRTLEGFDNLIVVLNSQNIEDLESVVKGIRRTKKIG